MEIQQGVLAVEGVSPPLPSGLMAESSIKRDFGRRDRRKKESSELSFRQTGSLRATKERRGERIREAHWKERKLKLSSGEVEDVRVKWITVVTYCRLVRP